MKKTARVARFGMTLMEIMIAILILSIGLLGVLATIPFGAMQMGKMVEKDFVASTANNAHHVIATNGWCDPANSSDRWNMSDPVLTSPSVPFFIHEIARDNLGVPIDDGSTYLNGPLRYFDFTFPQFLDPLGFSDIATPGVNPRQINLGFTSVSPMYFCFPPTVQNNPSKLDFLLRTHDDIIYDRPDNSINRPTMVPDPVGPAGTAAFTGEYSWMAMMTPRINLSQTINFLVLNFSKFPPAYSSTLPNVLADKYYVPTDITGTSIDMRVDVVVFRGRVPGDTNDYLVANATLSGSGYAGGLVNLERPASVNLADAPAYARALANNLKSSTHLLLIGPSDDPNEHQYFARWYKIGNFSEADLTTGIPVTLIGESCPESWQSPDGVNAGNVRAMVFKSVRGVNSRTVRLSSDEND